MTLDHFKLLSLGAAAASIYLFTTVLYLWFPSFIQCLRQRKWKHEDWFIIGVFFSFTGKFLDSGYWQAPWTASYLGLAVEDLLFHGGVIANLPFRQGLGSLAAYCHMRSFFLFIDQRDGICKTNRHLRFALIIGASYAAVVYMIGLW